MKSLSLVLLWIALATCLFAQQEVIVKKEKSAEKVVSVNVEEGDNGQRIISITTDSDGDQSVFKWNDNGEIPADIKKQLEDANIDIAILDGSGDQREIRIEVDEDIESDKEIRKMIVIKKDDGEGMMEMDWDGEGEMPAEMQKLLEEHDIDIDELHEEHGSRDVRVRKKMKSARGDRRMKQKKRHSKAMKDGRRRNKEEERSYKIITKDDEGNEKVMEWTTDDEGPEHMEKDIHIMRLGGGRSGAPHRDGNVFFFADEEDDVQLSDAYMGAQIETSDKGALILDVMKDSPADKAGLTKNDIVTRVNGARARSMDGLLTLLTFFDPDDQVELTVTRDGKEKKLKMTLGKRPDAYR